MSSHEETGTKPCIELMTIENTGSILGHVCARLNLIVHAYRLMTNHYHGLVETVDGNLSEGMRM